MEKIPVPVLDHNRLAKLLAEDPIMLKLLLPHVVPSGPASTTGIGVTCRTILSVTVAIQGKILVTVAVRVTVTSVTLGV